MKKFLNILIAFIFLTCLKVSAEDFYITNYDININLSENNIASITEDISVNFTAPRHGIYRDIPLKSKFYSADNKELFIRRFKVSNLKVYNEAYTKSKVNNNLEVKIGNPEVQVSGNKGYLIKYNYDLGNDKLKNLDEFYFNIIGTQWDTQINHVNFRITMPKTFDMKKLNFYTGNFGQNDYDERVLRYSIFNDKTITGSYNGVLNPHEGITLRIVLPEGYFNKRFNLTDSICDSIETLSENFLDELLIFVGNIQINWNLLELIALILFPIISFLMWYFIGKDNKVQEVVSFYPPENLNSAYLGFFYKGEFDSKQITSLIIYLANKGYLKIDDTDKKNIQFIKLKDYDGNDDIEKSLLKLMFGDNNVVNEQKLKNSPTFYDGVSALKDALNYKKDEIFEMNSISLKNRIIMSVMLVITLYICVSCLFSGTVFDDGTNLLMAGTMLLGAVLAYATLSELKFIFYIFAIATGVYSSILIYNYLITSFNINFLISIIGSIIQVVCLIQLPKRNNNGTKLLGEIEGFKHFIETAEKSRIVSLVEQEPTYFYNIIPYAYVLGISDLWIGKFGGLFVGPTWCNNSTFNLSTFDNIASSINSSVVPTTSNGGISSNGGYGCGGGGFSGGGCGGGGGGSW